MEVEQSILVPVDAEVVGCLPWHELQVGEQRCDIFEGVDADVFGSVDNREAGVLQFFSELCEVHVGEGASLAEPLADLRALVAADLLGQHGAAGRNHACQFTSRVRLVAV